MAENDLVGQTELVTEPAHLVFEQLTQRFNELEGHVLGEPADVVVALDHRCGAVAAATFDHIGVQRALHEELRVAQPTGVLFEDAYEQLTDDLALRLGLGHTLEPLEVPFTGTHVDQLDAHVAAERLDHLIALVEPHQPGVDVDACQLRADRAMYQRRGDGRIDATAERADHPARTHLGPHRGDLLVDDRRHRPCPLATGQIVQEPAEHRHAVRGVHHLGVVLHAPDPCRRVLQHGHRCIRGGRGGNEARRHLGDRIEVAHPHVVLIGDLVGEQRRFRTRRTAQPGPPILATHTASDDTAELMRDQLRAVADAKDGDAKFVYGRVECWRAVDVDALRSTRQDQRRRPAIGDLARREAVRHDLGVHIELAHAAGDELGVLSTEIDHEDRMFGGIGSHGRRW